MVKCKVNTKGTKLLSKEESKELKVRFTRGWKILSLRETQFSSEITEKVQPTTNPWLFLSCYFLNITVVRVSVLNLLWKIENLSNRISVMEGQTVLSTSIIKVAGWDHFRVILR